MDNKYEKNRPVMMNIEELKKLEETIDMNDICNEKSLEMFSDDPN